MKFHFRVSLIFTFFIVGVTFLGGSAFTMPWGGRPPMACAFLFAISAQLTLFTISTTAVISSSSHLLRKEAVVDVDAASSHVARVQLDAGRTVVTTHLEPHVALAGSGTNLMFG